MTWRLLDRYIAKNILAAIALVTLMLAGLQIFILFVNQLGDLGRAHYGITQAAYFVLLQIPYQVYLFFPMASLLGGLIGLGLMANHRELVVMRAAGMSVWQVTLAVLRAALFVTLLVTVLGETVVPQLVRLANDSKLQAISGGQMLRTGRGMWLRHQQDFITVGAVSPEQKLERVYQFRFDSQHRLILARKLDSVSYQQGTWVAQGVSQSIIEKNRVHASFQERMVWDVEINPKVFMANRLEPDEMTLPELHQVVFTHDPLHTAGFNYQLAYWQRLMQPLTTAVMMLLAIPFIFGPLRSSTMGAKLLAGATVGFGFHILNRFFGPVSQVFQWPVEVAAFTPTILCVGVGLYLMRRVK